MAVYKAKKLTLTLAVFFSLGMLVYFSLEKPSRLIVTSDGPIEGKVWRFKEWVQGKSFWENQLFFVNNELNRPSSILLLLEKLGESDRITEEALMRSNEILLRSENEHVQKYLSSESYQLKEESERLRRQAERVERFELLNTSYQNSLSEQEKYLNLKALIEGRIASYR